MKKTIITLLLFLFIQSSGKTQKNKPSEDKFSFIEKELNKVLTSQLGAGFAVAIVEKNKIVFAKGFGYRDYENKIPVTPQTLFAIGSCTKAFTAGLIGILEQEGKLNLDEPLQKYLPELTFFNNDMNYHITLRDAMSHRTGLPRHDLSWYLFKSNSRDSLIKRIQYQEPTAPIRTRWQYNNFMYLAQGVVAEKITKKSWEAAVKEKIFQPLGIQDAVFSIEDMKKSKDFSYGYIVKNDSIIKKTDFYNIDAMGPAGSIHANVLDMSKWLISWINGGQFEGKEILPYKFTQQAMSAQMIITPALPTIETPNIYFSTYGLGWMLTSYKGHYRVEHGGNIDGFSASTSFFPTDSIGIVILTNQNGSSIPSIVTNIIADKMLGLPYQDWNAENLKNKAKAKEAAEKNKPTKKNLSDATKLLHPLDQYDGIYEHPGYGKFEIAMNADSLHLLLPGEKTWLHHTKYNVFDIYGYDNDGSLDTTQASPIKVNIRVNDNGDIDGATLQLEGGLDAIFFKKSARPKPIETKSLELYVGEFLLQGVTVKTYIKNNHLTVEIPGQPPYELVPQGNHKFAIKIVAGYFVQFEVTHGIVQSLTFEQPNGNFKATKK